MSTLITHEWLEPVGGSENVFEQIGHAFPKADRACLWNDAPERFTGPVQETRLARTPLRRSKAASLLFMSSAWRALDLGEHERVISSSHAFGHHLAGRAAREGRDAYAYVHSPARYIWAPEHDHRGRSRAVRAVAGVLRRRDREATHADVRYAANSHFVSQRIRTSWDRDAVVVHPPVDVTRLQAQPSWRSALGPDDGAFADSLPDAFVLGASRFVTYKRLDRAIEIGEALDLPVVLCGSGPDEERLRQLAAASTVPVVFTGRVSDELLYHLYQAASLFVFLAIEDFGIMPVEAIALGTATLVNDVGGAREIIEATGGGAIAAAGDVSSLVEQADQLLRMDMAPAAASATQFAHDTFQRKVLEWTSTGWS